MPEVDGKMRQESLYVFPFAIPGNETNHSKGMSTMPHSGLCRNVICAIVSQARRINRNLIFLFGCIRHSPACFTGSSGSSATHRQDGKILSSL